MSVLTTVLRGHDSPTYVNAAPRNRTLLAVKQEGYNLPRLPGQNSMNQGGWIRTTDLLLPRQAGTAKLPYAKFM